MSAKTDPPPPSTPQAPAAVAQSRPEGAPEPAAEPAPAPASAAPAIPRPGALPCFHIGAGVLRAARTHPYERRGGDPLYRPLRIFTLDPAASRLEGAVATVNVPYEPLQRGPVGALVEVEAEVPEDGGELSVNLNNPKVLIQDG